MSEENKQLKHRLMGFTLSVVLLGLLGTPWLPPESGFSTGAGLLNDRSDGVSILALAYLAMAVLILVRTTMGTTFFGGIVGLLATFLILTADDGWTGAPRIALGLWAVVILIGVRIWKDAR
ncbi:hypothetical protein OG474_02895 [Kribbella sp. NBC_01505]|uniref:hypothetical protein n=1 Tax=Kribbella sp. NBC_01505 TaxID=2903580 RepID=UPI0038658D61